MRKICSKIDFNSWEAHWVMITPELASHILEHLNPENRDRKPARVARYVKEIKTGQWIVQGATICFRYKEGDDGPQVLSDGQHRLEAIVVADKSLQMLVVCRLPSDAFKKTDYVSVRSHGDNLDVSGVPNGKTVSAALRSFYWWAPEEQGGRGGAKALGNLDLELDNLLERHPGIVEAVGIALTKWKSKLIAPRHVASLFLMCANVDHDAAIEFFSRVISGAMLNEDSPELLLNRRLVDDSVAKARLNDKDKAALILIAFNHFRSGRRLRVLKWAEGGGAKFPSP